MAGSSFIMTSERTGETITVKTEEVAAAGTGPAMRKEWKCTVGNHHVHREDVRKVMNECREESFWYRALPLSLGSMALTGGLIYNGIWQSSKRFGPFPKLAVAGIVGFAVGKASYAGTCRSKFQQIGIDGPGFGPWFDRGHPGPFKNSGHEHRCHHVFEDCKKKAEAAPAGEGQS